MEKRRGILAKSLTCAHTLFISGRTINTNGCDVVPYHHKTEYMQKAVPHLQRIMDGYVTLLKPLFVFEYQIKL
jgi:hypothetical protein